MTSRQSETDLSGGGAHDMFALYVELLGAETAIRALERLEAELRSLFLDRRQVDEDDMKALAGEAHKLISTATAIGFLPVARACRDFTESCGFGVTRAAFERTREVAVSALSEIARLRRDLQARSGKGGDERNGSRG